MTEAATPAPTPMPAAWRFAHGRELPLDRPRIMAILNLTPDSFYGPSRTAAPDAAVVAARAALAEGADLLDLGGESTRPGAGRVDPDEQVRRVVPVVVAIRSAGIDCPISVDTTRSQVAAHALDAGADIVNDVSAGLEDPGMLPLVAARRAGLILMHRLAPPDRDRYSDRYDSPPRYADVVADVLAFLQDRVHAARSAGADPAAIVVDPGLGFGKSVGQNLELIGRTREFGALGHPVLSALSRKSFVGRVSLGRDSTPDERLSGTIALSVTHALAGASIFRVHDVKPHVEALNAVWPFRSYPFSEHTANSSTATPIPRRAD